MNLTIYNESAHEILQVNASCNDILLKLKQVCCDKANINDVQKIVISKDGDELMGDNKMLKEFNIGNEDLLVLNIKQHSSANLSSPANAASTIDFSNIKVNMLKYFEFYSSLHFIIYYLST